MMNRFSLALVIGAGWLATGCIINSSTNPPPECNDGIDNDGDGKIDFPNDPGCSSLDDNDETDPGPTTGTFTATWQLQDWNDTTGTATTAACPTGADTVIVYTLPSGLTDPAQANKDLFNCTDGTGTTAPVTAGSYTTWVEVTDHSGAVLYAQSNSQVNVAIPAGGNASGTFAFQVNRGYVSASWTLQGAVSGNALTCTQAAVPAVEFDNMVGSNQPISDQFDCAPMQGTTNPLPIATYQLTVQAVDSQTPPNALGPGNVAGTCDVQFGNQDINKGSVVLQVDGV